MDTFTTMTGVTFMFWAYMGERFKSGVYLWLALIFAIIFALRMAEPMFYMGTAGVMAVLGFRVYMRDEDVRQESEEYEV